MEIIREQTPVPAEQQRVRRKREDHIVTGRHSRLCDEGSRGTAIAVIDELCPVLHFEGIGRIGVNQDGESFAALGQLGIGANAVGVRILIANC